MLRSPILVLSCSLLASCGGGSTPQPATPTTPTEPAAPVADSAPTPEPTEEPDPEPEPPDQVRVEQIEIDGDGLDEDAVRSAFDQIDPQYEGCYANALQETPDAKGGLSVTLLYVKGERKSVSASYGGAGAATVNSCFQAASTKLALSPAVESERVVVVLRLVLEPTGAGSESE